MPFNPAKDALAFYPKTPEQEASNWSRIQRALQDLYAQVPPPLPVTSVKKAQNVVGSIGSTTGSVVTSLNLTTDTFVKDVSWDTGTCVMTKTTGTVVTNVTTNTQTFVKTITPTTITIYVFA